MQPSPQVSVLMPVRDGERWLSTAIDSVLRQTLTDFELIVIDDGSVDRTPAILHSHATRDRRIRIVKLDRQGVASALNRGLAEARAALVARIDADDLCAPNRLAKQAEFLARRPEIALLGSWAEVIDE